MSCAVRVSLRVAAFVLCSAVAAGGAAAQWTEHFLVKGLQDLELFQTDASSLLLSKNEGDLAGAGSLRLWAAADFTTGFSAMAVGRLEGGNVEEENVETYLEQAFARYVAPKAHLTIDAGRVVFPLGNFSKRYLSTVNPLIGSPDSYDIAYPEGITVTGKVSFFDYRAAFIDLPIANVKYVPKWDKAWRPAVAVGFTPMIGFRLGAYATEGPYLGHGIEAMLPAGTRWRDYDETIVGAELEFSRGYFELNGDIAFSAYDVPTHGGRARGQAWFVEPKYTWTPRLFTALRLEKNDYPYISPVDDTYWTNQSVTFHDVEVGVGWRFTPDLVLKASYRRDRWDVTGPAKDFFRNGYAWGLQLSYAFDLRSVVDTGR